MQTLHDRLQQPDLVGIPDQDAMVILNRADETLTWAEKPIKIRDVLYCLQRWGVYAQLQYLAQRGTGDAVPLAVGVLSSVAPNVSPFDEMDIANAEVLAQFQAMGAGLIAAGILTQAQYDHLWNLRMVPQSWSDINVGRPVTLHEVSMAR
jgi:hypothetical protein